MNKLLLAILLLTPYQTYSQSMPQIYGAPPVHYIGSDILSVSFKTSPEVIDSMVPWPMVPVDKELISIKIAFHRVPEREDYFEMYVSIPVIVNGNQGNFHPLLYLDKAAPIVAGREIWGFPKVDGDFEFVLEENSINLSLSRNDVRLLAFSSSLSQPSAEVNEMAEALGFVIKEIPSADGSESPALHRLNSYTARNIRIYEQRVADSISFELFTSLMNFMPEIPIAEIVDAQLYKMDFILDYGKTEYDYLSKGESKKN